jgi:hypothetical protein
MHNANGLAQLHNSKLLIAGQTQGCAQPIGDRMAAMTPDLKRKTLACLAGALILTAVIAAALPQLDLKPGIPLPGYTDLSGGAPEVETNPLVAISIDAFWKAVLGILFIAGLIYNGYKLLRDVRWSWKNVLRSLFYLFIPILLLLGLLLIITRVHVTFEPPPVEALPPVLKTEGPPLGPLPPGLIWLVWLGLAAGLTGLGLWLALRPPAKSSSDRLKLEAERALQALKTGLDLRNVILRCYWQMAQVLQQEQGLEKEAAMTVREFERLLEDRGVPPTPVHQLTQLFEAARYGRRPSSPDDERQAVDCLTAIVHYSQARKPAR